MSPKLSILVPTITERHPSRVLAHLIKQAGKAEPGQVEVLSLLDNRLMTVGRKRNILLSIAAGDYFAFVDDDDQVELDYVRTILQAIDAAGGSDVICFRQVCRHIVSGKVERCRYGLGLQYASVPADPARQPDLFDWTGLPAHTMAWRTELVNDIEFPDGNFGEDVGWVRLACARAKTEYQIDKVLYYYLYDEAKSRTRGK